MCCCCWRTSRPRRFHLSLPRLPAPVTALAFQHTGATVAVVTATNALSMYDADTGRMTEWSQQNAGRLPGRFTRKAVTDPVRHITFNPGTSLLVLAGHAYLGVVDVSKPIPPQAEPEANRRRHKKPRRSMLTPAQNGHDAKRRHAPADDEPPQNFRLVTRCVVLVAWDGPPPQRCNASTSRVPVLGLCAPLCLCRVQVRPDAILRFLVARRDGGGGGAVGASCPAFAAGSAPQALRRVMNGAVTSHCVTASVRKSVAPDCAVHGLYCVGGPQSHHVAVLRGLRVW